MELRERKEGRTRKEGQREKRRKTRRKRRRGCFAFTIYKIKTRSSSLSQSCHIEAHGEERLDAMWGTLGASVTSTTESVAP